MAGTLYSLSLGLSTMSSMFAGYCYDRCGPQVYNGLLKDPSRCVLFS